jgi:hypothetical protein
MIKFLYRLKRNAGQPGPTPLRSGDDPFAHPEIASMDLRMLADLPPEQLRDREGDKRAESPSPVRRLSLDPKTCVS